MTGNDLKSLIAAVQEMKHSTLQNYAIPGLQSSLIGGEFKGKVRLFESTRRHTESITPHSHRFDFTAFVLRGSVLNRVYRKCAGEDAGDMFVPTMLTYNDEIGKYDIDRTANPEKWNFTDESYGQGDTYSMGYDEVHSIFFGRDAVVLFLEGPQITTRSFALEPYVNGTCIPLLKTEPWMFQKVAETF